MSHGGTIWLTGLSGAGKSTIAQAVADRLRQQGQAVEVLDGDEVRQQLSADLGFSRADRDTNIARIAYVADLLSRHGVIVIVAAISPYQAARTAARQRIDHFIETYVSCSLDELVHRDTKGLYARALRGEIDHFTGISDPYEPPQNPELVLPTEQLELQTCVATIMDYLHAAGWLKHHTGVLSASSTENTDAPEPSPCVRV